jgi:hypothetical protein
LLLFPSRPLEAVEVHKDELALETEGLVMREEEASEMCQVPEESTLLPQQLQAEEAVVATVVEGLIGAAAQVTPWQLRKAAQAGGGDLRRRGSYLPEAIILHNTSRTSYVYP